MGRETLLSLLLLLFGGLAAQPLVLWPLHPMDNAAPPQRAERQLWIRLWLPVLPILVVAAWLGGWALREPDPVHTRFDHGVLVAACLPFAWIALRAALRAAWALLHEPAELPVCTAGLWRPRVLFSPFFARTLEDAQIAAAWAHEQAHVRHRDPLRIWLAQLATDLQWPWPSASRRFQRWLEVLEYARDDEARRGGTSGVDLASAILATARRSVTAPARGGQGRAALDAALLGQGVALQRRLARLLAPLPEAAPQEPPAGLSDAEALGVVLGVLVLSCALGATYGPQVLHVFFAWTWSV